MLCCFPLVPLSSGGTNPVLFGHPLGKDPDGWGRLPGLCGEVFLCCVDMNSGIESWFILLSSGFTA